MSNTPLPLHLRAAFIATCIWSVVSPANAQDAGTIHFEDVTEKLGIAGHLKNWELGHGAAWGDVDNDGRADLYLGAFTDRPTPWGLPNPPLPNMLLLNKPEGFVLSPQPELMREGLRERNSNDVFVDLDNDGNLDLVAGNHDTGDRRTLLFQNLGAGKFRNVTPVSPPGSPVVWPANFPTRNVVPIDLDRDGLLDLIFCDGGYEASPHNPRWRLLALRNLGGFKFEDVSERYGFTAVPAALGRMACEQGLAMGDVNDDGRPDIFVAGSNRLFETDKAGIFTEAQPGFFTRPRQNDTLSCGAAFGDLDGDGRLDLITTEHGQPSRIHIYLNRRQESGEWHFVRAGDATGVAGLFPSFGKGDPGHGHEATRPRSIPGTLPLRNTHLALRDVDNDGRTDIMLAVIYRDAQGRIQPVVLRNLGNDPAGIPTFSRPADDSFVGYYASAPIADYDDDGRLDIFLCPWFTGDARGYLFRNVTAGGRWLQVRVAGQGKALNPMGIGATVRIYEAGKAGDPRFLLGRQDIAIGTGYASGDEALAYFGLGKRTHCDVEVEWQGRRVRQANVAADQITVVNVKGE